MVIFTYNIPTFNASTSLVEKSSSTSIETSWLNSILVMEVGDELGVALGIILGVAFGNLFGKALRKLTCFKYQSLSNLYSQKISFLLLIVF